MAAGTRVFRPEHRLRRPTEYAAVLSARERINGDWFDLRFRRFQGPSARLGLIVPKRLARRAVLRNLVKRLAREAFRDVRARLPAMDLVLRLKRAADSDKTADRRSLWRQEIDNLLNRLPN